MNSPQIFAFGSNLDLRQMKARCPRATPLTSATLRNFQLTFRGFSTRWKGGTASIERARGACVHGLIYRVPPSELSRLDAFEGHPVVYERVTTTLHDVTGHRRFVHLYIINSKVRSKPSVDYLDTILRAYTRLGFPRKPLLEAAFR